MFFLQDSSADVEAKFAANITSEVCTVRYSQVYASFLKTLFTVDVGFVYEYILMS